MKKALWKSVLAILLLAAVLASVYLRAGGRWFSLARMLLVYLMLASVSLPALFRAGKGARKLLLSPRTLIFATALAAMGVVYPLAKRFSLPRALAFEALLLFAGAVFFAGVALEIAPGRSPTGSRGAARSCWSRASPSPCWRSAGCRFSPTGSPRTRKTSGRRFTAKSRIRISTPSATRSF